VQTAAQRGDLSEQLLGRTRLDWFECTWEILLHMAIKHVWVGKGLEHDPILTSRGGKQCLDDVLRNLFYKQFASFADLLPFRFGL